MRFDRLIFVVILGIGLSTLAQAGQPMEPGAWQMHMASVAKDPTTGESTTGPETTMKVCLSEEFLAKDPYLTPNLDKERMEKKRAKCTTSDHKREGNSASWKISCTMADGSEVSMTVNNVAERHKLTSKLDQTIQKDGRASLASMSMEMSFLGECTSDMPKL
jgi:Protein of unknown function (DUF3617)